MATLTTGIGTLSLTVTGATGNGVSPIVLTVASVPDSVEVGQLITVAGVGGNTNANGDKTITAKSATTITFAGTGNGAYTSGGTISRKYATVEAWIAATNGALGGNIKVGEVYADGALDYTTPSANLTFTGATGTGATAYRHLKAWSTHRYNVFTGAGALLNVAVDNTFPNGLEITEQYFRITGLGIALTGVAATSGTFRGIDARNCANASLDGVTVRASNFASAVGLNVFSTGQNVSSYNCIATVDAGQSLAFCRGFLLTNLLVAGTYRAVNCLAVGCVGASQGYGFQFGGGTQVITNCIATGSSHGDFEATFAASVFASNLSSDDTATTIAGTVGSVGNVSSSSLYRYEAFRDYRPVIGSAAIDAGLDYSSLFTTDILGVTRVAPWEIGPFQGYAQPDVSAPTVVEESIGATGRDYATIADWVAATALHLVSREEIRRGVLYDDADFAEQVIVEGATTDSRRYRELVPATGQRYDPVRDSGVTITDGSGGATVTLAEDFARLTGVKVANTYNSSGTNACVSSTSSGIRVVGVVGVMTATTAAGEGIVFYSGGTNARFRNCIAIGNSNTAGASKGFIVEGSGSKVQNCAAIRIRRGTTGTGFMDDGTGGVLFENCACASSDIGFNVTTGWQNHNGSFDTTASGPGAVQSFTATSVWTDSANNDLRLIAGSVLVNAGFNLSLDFTDDITGATRTGTWEIGPYDGFLAPPRWPKVATKQTHRLVPIWKLERRDGVTLLIAGCPEAIVHDGETYEPEGGLDATAHRREASLRDHSLEAAGIISSDRITFEDLDAGLYNGARLTMKLVDLRYPWAAPATTSAFVVRRVNFDGEGWRAEIEGITALLKRVTGRVYGAACPYKFGSSSPDAAGRAGCGIDATLWTQYDVEVATVTDDRLVFEAKSSAPNELPTSADDWYTDGWLIWATGDNAGVTCDIRDFVNASREITLHLETPYPIQVGDRFAIVAGDDHSFTTCKDKFSNAANFGGDPFIPGTAKAVQTPTQ